MSYSKNPQRYGDIRPILDIALEQGKCHWQGDDPKQVIMVRQRLYTLLKIIEEIDPMSVYLSLVIRRCGDLELIVERRSLPGKILTPHTPKPPEPVRDPFELAATKLGKEAGDE